MHNFENITYNDLDWKHLWRNAREQKSWTSKGAADWDRKAASFAERNRHSAYVSLVLARLPLNRSLSILDVGSGPGTLALPLAAHVSKVTAVDYSRGMLEILERQAAKEGITNIRTIHGSWEDDWQDIGIEPHDLVIASRSMNVTDLAMAISKVNSYAGKYVFITDRIAPSPFDPGAFAAIGRQFNSGPDYIYTLNMLYQLNIHPCVDILELDRDVRFKNIKEAIDSYAWMFKELTETEKGLLEEYLDARTLSSTPEELVIRREFPPRWAMIWWKKSNPHKSHLR